jgi:hypothetical protein
VVAQQLAEHTHKNILIIEEKDQLIIDANEPEAIKTIIKVLKEFKKD